MRGRSLALAAGLVIALAAFQPAFGEISPATPTTPSFDLASGPAPGTPLQGPGCPVTGSWSTFTGPDGTVYAHISQINVVAASPTPCPGFEPTPAPTATPTPTPIPIPTPSVITTLDDPAFTYFGTWGVYVGTGKYGPGDHFTRDSTASYGFLFTGTAVTLYTQTAPWMAIASVSVDGGTALEFDAYAATATQQVPFFRSGSLAPGVHRVIVHHTGRTNPAGTSLANGGQQVTVDRADITDGAIVPPLVP